MSKSFIRLLGGVLALAGAALLAYAAFSYVSQRQLEAELMAQIPGQTTPTVVALTPAPNAQLPATSVANPPVVATNVSPSVTPIRAHATPIQPDATTAAQLQPTAVALAAIKTPGGNVNPTPGSVSGAPTVLAIPAKPKGAVRGFGSPATRLAIPKLNLDLEVRPAEYVTYTQNGSLISDWNVPYDAAGHLITTAQPGEIGNAVISGHHNLKADGTFGLGIFAGLWNLAQGDEVRVTTADGKQQVWRVTESFAVKESGEPFAVRVQHAQEIMGDRSEPTLTLLTCWNGQTNPLAGNTYRWVIHAELVSAS